MKLKRDSEAYKKGTSQNEFDAILKFKQDYCMTNVYQYVYETLDENPLTYVELRVIFGRCKSICETNNVPVDPNITRFRNSFEKFMSDDLEIMKPGKTLCWLGERDRAAYHAVRQQSSPTTKVVSAVLPIFHSAATRSMMKHSLDISLSTTNFLNEGQITIVCADQPLYAICKQLQWLYPSKIWLG